MSAKNSSWSDPKDLEEKLPTVEVFDQSLLPDSLRPWITDIAERMQVPLDYPAAVLVVILGGAIGRRACIQPKAKDTTWVEVPNLYGGIVAPPGFMKSPVMSAITRHVEEVERRWHKEFTKATAEFNRDNPDKKKRDESQRPKLKRLIVNDATFEKLHEIMSENPLGSVVIRDELTGLLASFERSGHEGERQFYLTAWNGYSPYKMDRIQRGTVCADALCLSLMGGIQPVRLREYLVDLCENDSTSDGMIQRFQLLVWPDSSGWTYVDRTPNQVAQRRVQGVFDEILKLAPGSPIRFSFSPLAQGLFVKWLENIEIQIRKGPVDSALTAHISKYRGLMPSLALIFEMAERSAGGFVGFEGAKVNSVSHKNAVLAVRWCEYLESHARRIYSILKPEAIAARELAKKLKERVLGTSGPFTCRDVYLKGWRGLTTPDDAKAALKVLEHSGWVRLNEIKKGQLGGRPTAQYLVNPKVWRSNSK